MAFSLDILKNEYDSEFFFTSDRQCIEYLLLENLDFLEEYALLVAAAKAWLFTPHPVECKEVKQVMYEGYSDRNYQDKAGNILKKLDEFSLPAQGGTAFEKLRYADYFRNRGCALKDLTQQVLKKAGVKTPEQWKAIENCVEITENCYRAIADKKVSGESEISLFRYVRESIVESTGYNNRMIYDFLAGKRTGEVSGHPTLYRIKEKDTLIADLLPRHRGVYADMTRTFFAGTPTDKQVYIYEVLCEAIQAGEQVLRPGADSREIYEAVYAVFKKYGIEGNFVHHAGHGLGMGYYEAPWFLKEQSELIQENMVVALEPGLYFKGEFGIRIENNYRITENGAKRLGTLPLEMETYILKM